MEDLCLLFGAPSLCHNAESGVLIVKWLGWLVLLVAALYGFHRRGLWMEERGWLRRKGRGATAAGSAMLELQAILHPPQLPRSQKS